MQKVVLIGNPNTGKTTLFNALTSSNEHVGNWHGVTVDKKEKYVEHKKRQYCVIDLPGTYSLSPFSIEEKVTSNYIRKSDEEIFVVVCEKNNLRRNLFLVLEMLELQKKCVIALNIKNEQEDKNLANQLKKILGVKVFCCNFKKDKNIKYFFEFLEISKFEKNCKNSNVEYLKNFPLEKILNSYSKKNSYHYSLFDCIRFLENDFSNISKNTNLEEIKKISTKENYLEKINLDRYKQIENICNSIENQNKNQKKLEKYEKNRIFCIKNAKKIDFDKVFLNKYLALPIFLLIMLAVFFVTFSSVGSFLSDKFECFLIDFVGSNFIDWLKSFCQIEWVISFFENAIIGGLGSVLVFLPQVVLLFLFLTILEESGYLSRIAYVLENFFNKMGLSGKSVFTWLMGFGCTATAIMTARNLNEKNPKIKTIITTAFVPCNAKLPIFAVLTSAFFSNGSIFVIFGFYIFACITAMLVATLLHKTVLNNKEQSFILEFPDYQIPSAKDVVNSVWLNTKNFLSRVGSFLFCFSIIIWILQSFSFDFHFINENSDKNSIMYSISNFFAPLFAPLGFGNWGAVSCLFAGLIAKELVVSTMGIFNGVSNDTAIHNSIGASVLASTSVVSFDIASALSFLTFVLLYPPCIATFSAMRSEIGTKATCLSYSFMILLAYCMSLTIFQICNLFVSFNVNSAILCLIAITIIVFLLTKLTRRKKCSHCKMCKKI